MEVTLLYYTIPDYLYYTYLSYFFHHVWTMKLLYQSFIFNFQSIV